MVNRLVLAVRAFATLARICRKHEATESGGLLAGTQKGTQLIVPFVIAGGPNAHRSRTLFQPDFEAQQSQLDFLFERFEGVDYCGDWHRHLGSFDRPSVTDFETARQIVESEEWNTPEAVFPIAVLDGTAVRLRAYLMTRAGTEFEEIPIELVPDADPRIKAVLLSEVPVRKEGDGDAEQSATGGRARGSRAGAFLRRLAGRVWVRSKG